MKPILPFCAAWLAVGCTSSKQMNPSKGALTDATMNTVTIVTEKSDTLQFSTVDADKEEEGAPAALGEMQQATYQGLLPAASGPGIVYLLTICSREHSGDGTFRLTLTYKEADNGKDKSFTYQGKRFTQRGIPGNNDATVWQCISDEGNETFNFLKENETTLTLLDQDFKRPQTSLNYSLTRKEQP